MTLNLAELNSTKRMRSLVNTLAGKLGLQDLGGGLIDPIPDPVGHAEVSLPISNISDFLFVEVWK